MRLLACLASLFALQVTAALANTEKVIFVSPASTRLPDSGLTFDALQLDTLSVNVSTLRTALPVAFPSHASPRGLDSWYLLQLQAKSRYEVRICWPAVQPTEFWLDVFNTSHVFGTPELIQGLATFSENRIEQGRTSSQAFFTGTSESILFLRVQAAADYFSKNTTLMQHPEPVQVDIILDRYLANVFPASLVPTAAYLLVLAVFSFYLSGWIWNYLRAKNLSKVHTE